MAGVKMTAMVIKPLICHLDPVPVKQLHTNLHTLVNHVTGGAKMDLNNL